MKKKIYCFLSTAILLGGISTSAFADTVSKHVDTKPKSVSNSIIKTNRSQKLIRFLDENGVSPITRNELINKYKSGYMWDSWKNSENYIKEVQECGKIKHIFKDGSICVYNIEPIASTPKTKANVSMGHGQSHKSGRNTYYTNAKVSFENGGVDAFFFADFCTVKGGRSYISDIYADHIHVDEGYYDKNSKFFKITQRSENGQTGAKALLKFTAHIYQTSTGGGAGGVDRKSVV